MNRQFARRMLLLCFVVLLLQPRSISCLADDDQSRTPAGERKESQSSEEVRTVQVLTVGNSFAANACRYLTRIAESGGSVRIVVGTANLPGCSLKKHAKLAAQSASDPSVKPYRGNRNLQELLQSRSWDYVTLQQRSADSFHPSTFQPWLGQLATIVHQQAPSAKLLIHETWAYRPDAPRLHEANINQQNMYDGLKRAYAAASEQLDCRIIPVGTAFQAARRAKGREVVVRDPEFDFDHAVYPNLPRQTNSLVIGWHWKKNDGQQKMRLDCRHCNEKGSFLAGLVWYEVLTGLDARATTFLCTRVKQTDGPFLRRIAHTVVADTLDQ